MSAVNALQVVVQDLRDMEQCGMDDTGDFLAGELGEDPGTLNLLIMLLKLINGTPSEADLSEQLQQAIRRWMNYRFQHSPSIDKLLRTEVDRLVRAARRMAHVDRVRASSSTNCELLFARSTLSSLFRRRT
ncbi:hypothetical protein BWQ96_10288 [Gracilariopsis chorda]|uniref:Uncharacterized protein n=1 Tax=Gracilariopsis chorda TaxID=448386 RepID=A0A2V3ID33_9FLOR|nr:hypothetical protein BWQ96_10288 [Gracilariopsis chorda]|eukprot:PXF39996.1 hypothetical protein BWQ96_10288 [Gracilariopsis chorda]